MLKVYPGKYFESVEENKELNAYLNKEFGDDPPTNAVDLYLKERYNTVYVPGSAFSDFGHFVFERETDAIMFILRWS